MGNLSIFPPAVIAELSLSIREEYRSYATSLSAEVSEDATMDGRPRSDELLPILLGLRSKACSFLPDVVSAKRYAQFLLDGLKTFEREGREAEFDRAILGLLAPCHNPKLLGFARGDDELRREAALNLLMDETAALAKCHEDCLSNPALRVEYSAMLLLFSEIFEYFGEDLSGFFRHAGANAFLGEPTGDFTEWNADSVRLH